MWKHTAVADTAVVDTRTVAVKSNRPRLADWPWRKILADAGLLAAFAVTSSLLIRR